MGLWTRLNSHASGRRSGDQLNVYICDRFIIPALTPAQQHDIGHGHLLLDQLTRAYIRQHLNYRFQVFPDGTSALAIERDIRAGWTSPSRRSTSTYHGSRSDRKAGRRFRRRGNRDRPPVRNREPAADLLPARKRVVGVPRSDLGRHRGRRPHEPHRLASTDDPRPQVGFQRGRQQPGCRLSQLAACLQLGPIRPTATHCGNPAKRLPCPSADGQQSRRCAAVRCA
jgi:hypothetical protein